MVIWGWGVLRDDGTLAAVAAGVPVEAGPAVTAGGLPGRVTRGGAQIAVAAIDFAPAAVAAGPAVAASPAVAAGGAAISGAALSEGFDDTMAAGTTDATRTPYRPRRPRRSRSAGALPGVAGEVAAQDLGLAARTRRCRRRPPHRRPRRWPYRSRCWSHRWRRRSRSRRHRPCRRCCPHRPRRRWRGRR